MSDFEQKPGKDQEQQLGIGVADVNITDILKQLAAPFADIDLPPGFEEALSGRYQIPALLVEGLRNSPDPNHELERLQEAYISTMQKEVIGEHSELLERKVTAEQVQNPAVSIDLTQRSEIIDKLTTPKDRSQAALMGPTNSWTHERKYFPYDHGGVAALRVGMSVNPFTGKSESSLSMVIHPEYGVDEQDSIIAALLQVRRTGEAVFNYALSEDEEGESYKNWNGRGKGVVFESEVGNRTVIELNGHILTMTNTAEIADRAEEAPEETDQDDPEKVAQADEARQQELKEMVALQLDFTAKQFPAFIQHISNIWGKSLPREVIKPQVGHSKKASELFDEADEDGAQEVDIPEILTDPRHRQLYSHTVRPAPNVSFEMIGGLGDEVQRMKQVIAKTLHPERYESVGLDPRSTALLVGPPGTGKTMMAEAVATAVDGLFLAVKGSDIFSMWAGEAQKNVAAIFEMVELLAKDQKVVLFFDEIEALAPNRAGQHMMEHERKTTAEFLSALNKRYPGAIVIGATNAPGNVDPAVTRPGRFTDIVTVGNPDATGREHIINNWLNHYRERASVDVFNGVDVQSLARISEGLNGADLRTIVEAALVAEVEAALEEKRDFESIGTVALRKHIEVHTNSTQERFSNYLTVPAVSSGGSAGLVTRVS